MSLKELTKDKHQQAETTAFMKAIFEKSLPINLWIDWTYQKSHFYNKLEEYADRHNILVDLPDICRAQYLSKDYLIMNNSRNTHNIRSTTNEYILYLDTLREDSQGILAHLYTWHMGDIFGGQMIKKLINGSHLSLNFEDISTLMQNFRVKLTDDLAPEANIAFDWAIKMMKDYDGDLEQNRISCQTF